MSRHRRLLVLSILLACGALSAAPAEAAWPQDAALSTAPGDQGITWSRPPGVSVTADGQGGSILAWEDRKGLVMRLQRLSSAGVALWTPGGVAPAPTGCGQNAPRVVADGAGGAYVAWLETRAAQCGAPFFTGNTLSVQRVAAQGQPLWQAGGIALAGTSSGFWAGLVVLTSDAAGSAYVVWVGGGSPPGDIRAQRLDGAGNRLWGANGVSLGVSSSSGTGHQAVADGAGGLLVAWNQEPTDPYNGRVMLAVQRLNTSGAALWTPGGVLVAPGSRRIGLVSDGSSGAIVSFWGSRYVPCPGIGECSTFEARAQRVAANGSVLWADGGVVLAPEHDGTFPFPVDQLDPDLVSDGAGGAIVAWTDERDYGLDDDIYAQRIGPDGSRLWSIYGVAIVREAENQDHVRLVSDGAGGALIAWLHSPSPGEQDLFVQRVDAAGHTLWSHDGIPVSTAPGNHGVDYGSDVTPGFALEVVAPGEAVAVWPDGRNGPCQPSSNANCDVYAQRVSTGVQVPALPWASQVALAALLVASTFVAATPKRRASQGSRSTTSVPGPSSD